VANAANAEEDWAWLNAVNSREVIIDPSMPGKKIEGRVELRDLREDGRLGLALQGPMSAKLLCSLADRAGDRWLIERLEQNTARPATIAGIDCTVAGTGYTGEAVGFEIYVHPSRCVELWNALLEEGEVLGVAPVGLGARDSTRTEAGFPLFGHELEGPCKLSLTETGYGFVTRFHVPFFIGRHAYVRRMERAGRKVIRLCGQGRRSVRPGHVLIDAAGGPVGQVTSFAYTKDDFTFFVLAAVQADLEIEPGDAIRAVREPAAGYAAPPKPSAIVGLQALTRFPEDDEPKTWPQFYA